MKFVVRLLTEGLQVRVLPGVLSMKNALARASGATLEARFSLLPPVILTEDWMDAEGNYYPESALERGGDGLFTGVANGVKVERAPALYTHSRNLVRIPRWKTEGKSAAGLLLHEMAHSAANESDVDHGPKWHAEMNRLWKQGAPINLQDVTPGQTEHALVGQYGIGSKYWESL